MKKKKIMFRKLTVKETAEVLGAKGTPGNSWKCRQVDAFTPGEVPGRGNCTSSIEATYPVGDLFECNPLP